MNDDAHNPYQTPTITTLPQQPSWADTWSPRVIRGAIVCTPCWALCAIAVLVLQEAAGIVLPNSVFWGGVFAHAAVMSLNFAALGFVCRDWRLRNFENLTAKCLWLLAIVFSGGIGTVWYIVNFNLYRLNHQQSSDE